MANSQPTRGSLFRHIHRKPPRPTAQDLTLARLSSALIEINSVAHRHTNHAAWVADGEETDLAVIQQIQALSGVALLVLFDDAAENGAPPWPR